MHGGRQVCTDRSISVNLYSCSSNNGMPSALRYARSSFRFSKRSRHSALAGVSPGSLYMLLLVTVKPHFCSNFHASLDAITSSHDECPEVSKESVPSSTPGSTLSPDAAPGSKSASLLASLSALLSESWCVAVGCCRLPLPSWRGGGCYPPRRSQGPHRGPSSRHGRHGGGYDRLGVPRTMWRSQQ